MITLPKLSEKRVREIIKEVDDLTKKKLSIWKKETLRKSKQCLN